MSENISFSIIIPCYNSKKWIGNLLDSILKQIKNINCEIIIVDDGSIDGTYKYLIDNYSSYGSIKIFSKKNGGVSSARNYGLLKSKNKYILFMDSDDNIIDNFFVKIMNYINNSADLYVFGTIREYNNELNINYPVCKNDKYASKNDINYIIKHELISSPCNKIYLSSIIKQNKLLFDERIKIAEDYLFNMEYLKKCKDIYLIKDCLYKYIITANDNSLTKIVNPNKYKELTMVDNRVKKLFKDNKYVNYISIKHLYSCLIDCAVSHRDYHLLNKIKRNVFDIKPYGLKQFIMTKCIVLIPNTLLILMLKNYKQMYQNKKKGF